MKVSSKTYTIGKTVYPRVTTVIGKYGSEYLLNWAVDETVNHIDREITPLAKTKPHEIKYVLPTVLKTAKNRHEIIKRTAGDRGTEIHTLIEKKLKGNKIPKTYDEEEHLQKILKNVDKWVDDWGFTPSTFVDEMGITHKSIELTVRSETYGYAGTVDLIGTTKDNQTILADIKTGKTTRKTMEAQMAAYAMAWTEMGGTRPDLCFVLHVLPSGNLKEKHILDPPAYQKRFDEFLGLLKFYKAFGD